MKMLNAIDDAKLAGHGSDHGSDHGADHGSDHGADAAALQEAFGILLRTLYPAAPHITHVLWEQLGYSARHGEIIQAPWPVVDEDALLQDEIELVLQVSGKLRGTIRVSATADRASIEAAALASPEFLRFSEGKAAKKVVVVPGRVVNVVV